MKTDEEIILLVKTGDLEAFSILVERYRERIIRYAKKFLIGYDDAEDLVQEVFIKAYINIKGFDDSRKFSSWLYRIAHNEFINAIKKRKNEPVPFFDPDSIFPHPIAKERADAEIVRKETKKIIEKTLDKLKPKYREPLILYYFEDMTYKQIADVMRIPISTVGIRIKRAKEKAKLEFEKLNK
ncbi:MAG: hypothetical protein COT89_00450 [Candidatus Colwellbacteria bacterium CG10_big_fil_rev_8_21_14_0_10_42_22]|uniref:RNA polymerase sigma factor n=1 Tax=Candidatus Colwellbacteria bacterium CG10_big_fil_rev_8_21_14_0_10_42_22 TaxID=1974540 RepID=A0A2H0VGH0_9BACT|nr:MAG: hypothetical protein COT89_00450 [Candidatus Colwellbacteria bacterium CG10_big_fil_rev_8_21_14_0_10_42_22]